MAIFGKPILSQSESDLGADDNKLESPEQRENNVRNDLLKRLKSVCKDLPEEEFQDLVAAMTREQLRSERLR
ncbi:MAG: hypothetical protein M3Z17_08940 [Gemmatimonadota bacterium]|nr:hypothetical protein [Gemmatimonadota bacterium]